MLREVLEEVLLVGDEFILLQLDRPVDVLDIRVVQNKTGGDVAGTGLIFSWLDGCMWCDAAAHAAQGRGGVTEGITE